jgi:hypothetical protein
MQKKKSAMEKPGEGLFPLLTLFGFARLRLASHD